MGVLLFFYDPSLTQKKTSVPKNQQDTALGKEAIVFGPHQAEAIFKNKTMLKCIKEKCESIMKSS